jgi:hypothetical protein
MNLFQFRKGGVYKIVCTKNNKIYYGQTSCFIRRCFQHLEFLEENKHSCLELQKDVGQYGLDAFLFEVVHIENQLSKRLKLEKKCIESALPSLLYNNKNQHNFKTQPRVAQRVKILNCFYPSIAEAARVLGKSSRNIRMKLDDPSNLDYERLEYHRNIYFDEYAVKIDGKSFCSTRSVVEAGLAKTTRQVRDRCRSVKWKNWLFVEKGRTTIPSGSRVKSANPKQESSLIDEDIV